MTSAEFRLPQLEATRRDLIYREVTRHKFPIVRILLRLITASTAVDRYKQNKQVLDHNRLSRLFIPDDPSRKMQNVCANGQLDILIIFIL